MRERFKHRFLVTFSGLVLALTSVAVGAACSRPDASDAPSEEAQEPEWVPPHRHDAGIAPSLDASDGSTGYDASDGRAEHELAVLLDAGRFCGSRDLHDCPLQGWMKRNATPILDFGDISTIAVVFDQIAALAPPDTTEDGGLVYENWTSIARDGANATRTGNLEAAKAACRGCHVQYRDRYHAVLRARDLPPIPPAVPVAPPTAP
jgi:hypothetical protein